MTNEKGPGPGRVAERRTHPRYVFTADAEIAEPETGARIEARISDIGQRGCYVETPRSFPLGTAIRVQVTKGGDSFVAPARSHFTGSFQSKQRNRRHRHEFSPRQLAIQGYRSAGLGASRRAGVRHAES